MMRERVFLLLAVVVGGVAGAAWADPFFADGSTAWRIQIAAEAAPAVLHGVEEFTNALQKIGNVAFPVVKGGKLPSGGAVVIGDLSDPAVAAKATGLRLTAAEVEQVAVRTLDGNLYLAGNTPRGALYAVYSFLNRELGVRWLWPGADGEFMPQRNVWSLPQIDYRHDPGYAFRGLHICGDWRDHVDFRVWMGRNYVNIHRHAASEHEKRRGFYSFYSNHSAHLNPAHYFKEHPEYFAEIRGQRYGSGLCLTHPEVLRLVAEKLADYVRRNPQLEILSTFPTDTQDYCRCANCATMDVSTAWFSFYNRLTDILKVEFPDLKFATIAYQGYVTVPECEIRNSLFVEYATLARCNVHPFGHPGCSRNEQTLAGLTEWEALGIPLGNYGYEFDVFSGSSRHFMPFFTMLADAIREGQRRKQVALITEVSLSPRSGPVTMVSVVQNRLPTYLYAQLMWHPARPLEELLADWCATAYGPAATVMQEYFTALDRAWNGMDIHLGILGNSMNMVEHFMTPVVEAQAAAQLKAATTLLAGAEAAPEIERAYRAVEREVILLRQWQEQAALKRGELVLVNAPLLAGREAFNADVTKVVTLNQAETEPLTRAAVAWTEECLLVSWELQNTLAVPRDDDTIEVELGHGTTGEEYHFSLKRGGEKSSSRLSEVGVRDDKWSPAWQSVLRGDERGWQAIMELPFSALGGRPQPEESWQLRLRRGGGDLPQEMVYPARMAARLLFNRHAQTGRKLLYWSGYPEREARQQEHLELAAQRAGWEVAIVTNSSELLAAHPESRAWWFRHANGTHKVPESYWQEQLLPALRAGGVAFFTSYISTPLERYFDDPSFKVRLVEIQGLPLPGRKTTWLAPGSWGEAPYDLATKLQRGYSPCYGFVPVEADKWQVLALAADGPGRDPFPYLLVRRYGRGLVVLGGDSIPAPMEYLLQNLTRWHTFSNKAD